MGPLGVEMFPVTTRLLIHIMFTELFRKNINSATVQYSAQGKLLFAVYLPADAQRGTGTVQGELGWHLPNAKKHAYFHSFKRAPKSWQIRKAVRHSEGEYAAFLLFAWFIFASLHSLMLSDGVRIVAQCTVCTFLVTLGKEIVFGQETFIESHCS